MKITLLCNAGIMLETKNSALMIDLPNKEIPPFYELPEREWNKIYQRVAPYDKVCGFFFTHDHGDHLDKERLSQYTEADLPIYIPTKNALGGTIEMGEFLIEYRRIEHAPIENAPVHMVALIKAEGKTVYVTADAKLDVSEHKMFLNGRCADVALWNAMYLSGQQTRQLMREAARRNLIYHLPQYDDQHGIWAKCRKNQERYPDELRNVEILSVYPTQINV